MRKQFILTSLLGVFIVAIASMPALPQSLRDFTQRDFEQLMREYPELIEQVTNFDGTVNRAKLEEILRTRFNYTDTQELPPHLDFEGARQRLSSSNLELELDIENDVNLQKRLAEERDKAYEKYKKRQQNQPPQ